MRFPLRNVLVVGLLSLACTTAVEDEDGDGDDDGDMCQPPADVGPGEQATDERRPELGNDLEVLERSTITVGEALSIAEDMYGVPIEAKFELDDAGALSLSVYPLGAALELDAQRNVFQELAGDPTTDTWAGELTPFHDQEHLTRSARELTLVQLSTVSLRDAVASAEADGLVYWAVPAIQDGRAGYGVYTLAGECDVAYSFIDGGGDSESDIQDLGTGPGAEATDDRTPELGDDLSVLMTSQITMAEALAQVEADYGPPIEAKFELDEAGALSLSVYPAASRPTPSAVRSRSSPAIQLRRPGLRARARSRSRTRSTSPARRATSRSSRRPT